MSEVATLKEQAAKKQAAPANSAPGASSSSSWGLSSFLGASGKDADLKKLASKCAKQMQNFHTRLQVKNVDHTQLADNSVDAEGS